MHKALWLISAQLLSAGAQRTDVSCFCRGRGEGFVLHPGLADKPKFFDRYLGPHRCADTLWCLRGVGWSLPFIYGSHVAAKNQIFSCSWKTEATIFSTLTSLNEHERDRCSRWPNATHIHFELSNCSFSPNMNTLLINKAIKKSYLFLTLYTNQYIKELNQSINNSGLDNFMPTFVCNFKQH